MVRPHKACGVAGIEKKGESAEHLWSGSTLTRQVHAAGALYTRKQPMDDLSACLTLISESLQISGQGLQLPQVKEPLNDVRGLQEADGGRVELGGLQKLPHAVHVVGVPPSNVRQQGRLGALGLCQPGCQLEKLLADQRICSRQGWKGCSHPAKSLPTTPDPSYLGGRRTYLLAQRPLPKHKGGRVAGICRDSNDLAPARYRQQEPDLHPLWKPASRAWAFDPRGRDGQNCRRQGHTHLPLKPCSRFRTSKTESSLESMTHATWQPRLQLGPLDPGTARQSFRTCTRTDRYQRQDTQGASALCSGRCDAASADHVPPRDATDSHLWTIDREGLLPKHDQVSSGGLPQGARPR